MVRVITAKFRLAPMGTAPHPASTSMNSTPLLFCWFCNTAMWMKRQRRSTIAFSGKRVCEGSSCDFSWSIAWLSQATSRLTQDEEYPSKFPWPAIARASLIEAERFHGARLAVKYEGPRPIYFTNLFSSLLIYGYATDPGHSTTSTSLNRASACMCSLEEIAGYCLLFCMFNHLTSHHGAVAPRVTHLHFASF